MSLTNTIAWRQVSLPATTTNSAVDGGFPIQADTEVSVARTNPVTLADTGLVLNSDYSITGITSSTFTVTIFVATVNDIITIYRNCPITQPASYITNGAVSAKSIESSLDRMAQEIQTVKLMAERSVRLGFSTPAINALDVSTRKNRFIGFDSSGNLTFTYDMATVQGYATAAANSASSASGSATSAASSASAAAASAASVGQNPTFTTLNLGGLETIDLQPSTPLPSSVPVASNYSLRVFGSDSTATRLLMGSFANTGNSITGLIYNGSKASPTATSADGLFMRIAAMGYDGGSTYTAGHWNMFQEAAASGTNHGVYHTWWGTPTGSTTAAEWMRLQSGSLIMGTGALPTTATTGFVYIAGGTGSPSGTPVANSGRYPLYYDSTNNKLWIYNGSWRGVTLT